VPNQITDGPNPNYDFGYDFDYSVWPKDTQIDLVNVPWNNDYRDIVKFVDQTALNNYINSLQPESLRINQLSYVKPNTPVKINTPFNRAVQYNYLRVSNPIQPIPGADQPKFFYYFILDVRYNAPNTTELILQLDVVQTYIWNCTFGNCYVERGHIGIANTNAFKNYGRDYLTTPEGLDIGGEYVIISQAREKVAHTTFSGLNPPDSGISILVCATTDLNADPTNTDGSPNLVTAPGSSFSNLPSGASYYGFENMASFQNWLAANAQYPWKTQGIISVTVVPNLKRYIPTLVWAAYGDPTALNGYGNPAVLTHRLKMAWRDADDIKNAINPRYQNLKKFYTYPYMVVELTSHYGTPIIIKPESWRGDNATIREMASLIPPNQRVSFYPVNYNSNFDGFIPDDFTEGPQDYGDFIDMATMITTFPQVAIVNNMAISYMASNFHGIAYSYQAADWTQQRALGMNQASYDVASGGIQASRSLAQIANMGDVAQMGIANAAQGKQASNNLIAGVGGAAAIGVAGGPGFAVSQGIGAVNDALNAGVQMNANSQATSAGNLTRSAANAVSTRQDALVRDTNKSVADWAARGDYGNQIAGINAKVQDAKLLQPSTSGQIAGDAFNVSNNLWEVKAKWKFIDNSAQRAVGEYWLRYGYSIHAFIKMPASLMVMDHFTYWKLTETYIASSRVPEGFKQAIRGIFEKGVTVWANPADIGNIDIAQNVPLPGVSY
jgi:hypothetical protein